MTEQYIYSRSERGFVNSLNQTIPVGFGFMALSPGMDEALKQSAAVHCRDCPRLSQTDSQGVPLPLFRKALLPKGEVLLQKSAWIEKGSRDFHVAHGYVLDSGEIKAARPGAWLNPVFRLEDPNAAPDGIPPLESLAGLPEQKPFELRWLADAVPGLDKERFCQTLLACFDAAASQQQVLIAWDFDQPGEQSLRRSALYWIYSFLPYEMRARLGFDSVYTDASSPMLVQLAFVDKASIRGEGQTPGIQLGSQTVPLGGSFLIWDGKIIHNDGRYQTEWYRQDSAYASWLGQLVNRVWDCPKEKREDAASKLEDVWASLQRLLPDGPEKGGLNPENYRRACEINLPDLEEEAVKPAPPAPAHTEPAIKRVPDQEAVSRPAEAPASKGRAAESGGEAEKALWFGWYRMILSDYNVSMDLSAFVRRCLDRFPGLTEGQRDLRENEFVQWMLDGVLSRRRIPGNPADIQLLASMYGGRKTFFAMGFLGAFMAQEADAPGMTLCWVLNFYQGYLPLELYSQLLSRLFWDDLSNGERSFWKKCGVENSMEAARRRRFKWYLEIARVYNPMEDAASFAGRWVMALPGIVGQNRTDMRDELLMIVRLTTGRPPASNRQTAA